MEPGLYAFPENESGVVDAAVAYLARTTADARLSIRKASSSHQ
jgi:hypothetical protein